MLKKCTRPECQHSNQPAQKNPGEKFFSPAPVASVQREPVPAGPKLLESPAFYPASDFDGRFSGEVHFRGDEGMVKLNAAIEFVGHASHQHLDKKGDWLPEQTQKFEEFKNKFISEVPKEWSNKIHLKAACPVGGSASFTNKVSLFRAGAGQGTMVVHVFLEKPSGGRSNASGQREDGTNRVVGNMAIGDEQETENKWTDPKTEKEHTFNQRVISHEFGHMIGLGHIHGSGNNSENYGTTLEESRNMMGRGSDVNFSNAAPFIKILERFGRDRFTNDPVGRKCNVWSRFIY